MRLSLKNEELLKEALSAEDKKDEINKIAKTIEEIELGMKDEIDFGYLDIINKCITLEELRDEIKVLLASNRELRVETEELLLRYAAVRNEEQVLRRAEKNANEVKRCLTIIREFLEMALLVDEKLESIEEDNADDEIFYVTQALKEMEKKKPELKRYTFYRSIAVFYKSRIERFTACLRERTKEWINNMDFKEIGEGQIIGRENKLFNPRAVYRREVLPSSFLKIAYGARKLNLVGGIIKIIEGSLREHIQNLKINEKKGAVSAATSLMALNFAIQQVLPGWNSHHAEIFDLLEHAEPANIFEIVKLRQVAAMFDIESEIMDEFVERMTFRYFTREFDKSKDFFEELGLFIEEASLLLLKLGDYGGEMKELLAQRVDALLVERVNLFDGDANKFIELQDKIKEKLDLLKAKNPELVGIDFDVEEMIEQRNNAMILKKYESVKREIGKSEDMREIVETLLSIKKFMNNECRKKLASKLCEASEELVGEMGQDDLLLFKDTLKRNYKV